HFYPDDKDFVRTEIDSQSELKTAEQLDVPLPEKNVDFHSLALSLASSLMPKEALPADKVSALIWQRQKREQLNALLRIPRYVASAADSATPSASASAKFRVFSLGKDWSVPAVELSGKSQANGKTALLFGDAGRTALAADAARLLAAGYRVVAIDPLLWGES